MDAVRRKFWILVRYPAANLQHMWDKIPFKHVYEVMLMRMESDAVYMFVHKSDQKKIDLEFTSSPPKAVYFFRETGLRNLEEVINDFAKGSFDIVSNMSTEFLNSMEDASMASPQADNPASSPGSGSSTERCVAEFLHSPSGKVFQNAAGCLAEGLGGNKVATGIKRLLTPPTGTNKRIKGSPTYPTRPEKLDDAPSFLATAAEELVAQGFLKVADTASRVAVHTVLAKLSGGLTCLPHVLPTLSSGSSSDSTTNVQHTTLIYRLAAIREILRQQYTEALSFYDFAKRSGDVALCESVVEHASKLKQVIERCDSKSAVVSAVWGPHYDVIVHYLRDEGSEANRRHIGLQDTVKSMPGYN